MQMPSSHLGYPRLSLRSLSVGQKIVRQTKTLDGNSLLDIAINIMLASSPPDHARRAKKFVPSLQTVTLNDAGHWLMVERKDEVTRIVGDWIAATLHAETAKSKL
jgi:hypothetical protein